jgi:hypothetical protein
MPMTMTTVEKQNRRQRLGASVAIKAMIEMMMTGNDAPDAYRQALLEMMTQMTMEMMMDGNDVPGAYHQALPETMMEMTTNLLFGRSSMATAKYRALRQPTCGPGTTSVPCRAQFTLRFV